MMRITRPGSSSSKGPTSEPQGPVGGSNLRFGAPWAGPPEARDPLRRLRGRLVLPVTVWLAGDHGPSRGDRPRPPEMTGLTISSVFLGQGAPPVLAGLVSPTSDLADLLDEKGARFVVHVLAGPHKRLAQHFSGELPAPAAMLASQPSAYGPLLSAVPDRALCRVTSTRPFGWSLLVEAEVDEAQVGGEGKGLGWWRGAYQDLP
ncbi:MAG TPA: flavin reductase [Acidimicrobiales bacterium]|nr:flavin reductase [Acidimicrobiales bacterium]